MIIYKKIRDIRKQIEEWKSEGLTIGLVPTMGFLHEGHASLIRASKKQNDKTVVSIFVNPTQFGPNEDISKYPRDLENDKKVVEENGGDIIFNPEPGEMYPNGFSTYVDMTILTEELCGASGPVHLLNSNHFRGVCTVVTKLFNIVQPNYAYFGKKDAQQLAIVEHMVNDLNMNIKIIGCPTIRENDGLAKSSRNVNLSKEERIASTVLYKALELGKETIKNGEKDCSKIINKISSEINSEPLAKIDYVKIVDCTNMQQISKIDRPALCAIAVYIGKTRLIDNFYTDECKK